MIPTAKLQDEFNDDVDLYDDVIAAPSSEPHDRPDAAAPPPAEQRSIERSDSHETNGGFAHATGSSASGGAGSERGAATGSSERGDRGDRGDRSDRGDRGSGAGSVSGGSVGVGGGGSSMSNHMGRRHQLYVGNLTWVSDRSAVFDITIYPTTEF